MPPSPRAGSRPEQERSAQESALYLDSDEGQIYTVKHSALRARRGAVLLCGPFGVERERAYLTLVQWARDLAEQGFEVLRFDYRGTGESCGSFEDMTLSQLREDAAFCAAHLSAALHGGALVLQGVRLGALIAAELFASGLGDGLLLWAPPASAEALLRDNLRHNLVAQRMADPAAPPKVREQWIAALEGGECIDVDGYSWTPALWSEAKRHALLLPPTSETRPWRVMETPCTLGAAGDSRPSSRTETVDADTFWQSSSRLLVPHAEGFFRASLRWLDDSEPWRGSA